MHLFACRLLAFIVALSAAAHAATTRPEPARSPAAAQVVPVSLLAPADTYFGAFAMSPLSIRNTIGLLAREYHERTISDHDLLRKALITESALRKWRTGYPRDTWLPPTFFHLEQLYQAVQTDEAHKHANAILNDVVRNYGATKEGHLSRLRLAAGFPPLAPESPVVATPAPSMAPAAATSPQVPAAGLSSPRSLPSP